MSDVYESIVAGLQEAIEDAKRQLFLLRNTMPAK